MTDVELKCPACSAPIAAGDTFCEACGAAVAGPTWPSSAPPRRSRSCSADDTAPIPRTTMTSAVCAQCGGRILEDGFCGTCGQKARSPRDHWSEQPAPWVGGVCDKGIVHTANEDAMALAATPDGSLAMLVVCDGVTSAPHSDRAALAAARCCVQLPDVGSRRHGVTASRQRSATGADALQRCGKRGERGRGGRRPHTRRSIRTSVVHIRRCGRCRRSHHRGVVRRLARRTGCPTPARRGSCLSTIRWGPS